MEWCDTRQGQELAAEVGVAVVAAQAELERLLTDLVRARSANPPGDTTGVADLLATYLSERRLQVDSVQRVATKPNIVATVDSGRPGPHLVFNGHMDTIPPGEESDWSVPVYDTTDRDGRLYGLGTGNMKAADAAMAFACAWLAAHREQWIGKVTLTAVSDETGFGPDGAQYMLQVRPDLYGDALICGEGPGNMGIAIAEKGVCWLRVEAAGKPGQGMIAERGGSAVAKLARAIVILDGLADITCAPPPEVSCLAQQPDQRALAVTVNVGTIRGGEFVSRVSTHSVAEVDIRIPPGLTVKQIDANVAAAIGNDDVRYSRIRGWNPNWSGTDTPVVRSIAAAARIYRPEPLPMVTRIPGSDARRWREAGSPAVCFGPQPELASGVDDYVYRRDLLDCAKIYAFAAVCFLKEGIAT